MIELQPLTAQRSERTGGDRRRPRGRVAFEQIQGSAGRISRRVAPIPRRAARRLEFAWWTTTGTIPPRRATLAAARGLGDECWCCSSRTATGPAPRRFVTNSAGVQRRRSRLGVGRLRRWRSPRSRGQRPVVGRKWRTSADSVGWSMLPILPPRSQPSLPRPAAGTRWITLGAGCWKLGDEILSRLRREVSAPEGARG